MRNTWLAIV